MWRRKDHLSNPQAAGDPTATAAYDICVFDAAGLVFGAAVAPGGTCGGQPCWRATPTGYRYGDASGASGGLKKITLRSNGVPGNSSFDVSVRAKGANVLSASLADADSPVIAELRARTPYGLACWQTTFEENAIRRSSTMLKARN